MNRIEIRPTVPGDLDALSAALKQVHRTDGYPVEGVSDPKGWLHLPAALGQWTALLEGEPVGHVGMVPAVPDDVPPSILAEIEGVSLAETAVLARLFVAPSARGQALGGELIRVVEQEAQSMNLRLTLEVLTKDRSAIALYEKRGWTILSTFDHEYGNGCRMPAIGMVAPRKNTHLGSRH